MPLGKIIGSALVMLTLATTPGLADDHRHERHERHRHHHDDRDWRRDDDRHHRRHCPPGLARKGRDCVPPGHARHRHHLRVGDVYRGDRTWLRDPRRYALEERRGWQYYRDDDRIYRVDSHTQKVVAVINLLQALSR